MFESPGVDSAKDSILSWKQQALSNKPLAARGGQLRSSICQSRDRLPEKPARAQPQPTMLIAARHI